MMPLGRGREVGKRRLLHRALRGRHENVVVLVEFLHRHHRGDLLAFLEREHIDDGLAAARAAARGNLVDLEPVQPPAVGEAQEMIVNARRTAAR